MLILSGGRGKGANYYRNLGGGGNFGKDDVHLKKRSLAKKTFFSVAVKAFLNNENFTQKKIFFIDWLLDAWKWTKMETQKGNSELYFL